MRPFQRLGHLVEGAGELAQLPLTLGKPGADAQLPGGDSLRRSDEGLDLAHDEQVSTHPGRGEREASDKPQHRNIAGKNLVDAGKGDSRRDANAHVRVRALRSAAERRERKEARDAVRARSIGRAVALLSQNGVQDERLRHELANPFPLVRVARQDRAVAVDHGEHRSRRQSRLPSQF